MKTVEKGLFGLVLIFLFTILMTAPAFPQDTIVRAKIGIMTKSGDKSWYVKSQEKLSKGDKLLIYVRPEAASYVYIIHTDKKSVSLLFNKIQVRETTLGLPSEKDFYQIDGESPVEIFIIVCSSKEVKELSPMKTSELSYGQWASIEEKLINQSKIELGQTVERSIPIAGGVRGGPHERSIQTFSGKSLIIKKYEFSVKK
jgi:hypothetical protein